MRKASACLLLSDRSPTHQAREWWSAAEHFDRRFPASLRRDLVSLRAATKTPRRRLRCRAGNRLALLRYDVGRITIVAIPRGSIVAIPRRTDPHPARADGASEMRKGCSADTRRHRDPLWSRNCRPDHRPESATKGHGMAATKCVPASSQSFNRRRNQPGQEKGEETACDSNGHSERLLRRRCFYKRLGSCPLASRRWIAAASSWRLTLRMASVHAPITAAAVMRDASTIVTAR